MELLDSSMDKISDRVYQQLSSTIPEEILGKMTVSVSSTRPPPTHFILNVQLIVETALKWDLYDSCYILESQGGGGGGRRREG